MKKIIISALLSVTILSSAFAKKVTTVNNNTLRSFRLEFGNAKDVSWETYTDYSFATFQKDNKQVRAFFDFTGALLGTGTAATMEDLPVNVKRMFAKRYSNMNVTEIMKFEDGNEVAWFASASNDSKSVVLKMETSGITVMRETKK